MRESCWMQEMTWQEIAAYLEMESIALIPVGATEQHGPHMTLFMDTGWAVGIAEGGAKLAGVVVAPPLHYGWGPHHMGYAGTITIRGETLTQLCVDIGESLVWHGFKKLIFLNGNRVANLPPMQIAASRIRHSTGAYVAVADTGLIAKKAVHALCESKEAGAIGHAGESETSYMLYRFPEMVDMSRAVSLKGKKPSRFATSHSTMEPPFDGESVYVPLLAEEFRANTEAFQGVNGDALAATADKGRRMHEVICRALADFIEQAVRPRQVKLRPLASPPV